MYVRCINDVFVMELVRSWSVMGAANMRGIICIVFYIGLTLSQNVPISDPRCAGEVSCTSCVASAPSCAWCKEWGFSGPRCDLPEVLRAAGCPEEHVYIRGNSRLTVNQDKQFSDFGGDEDTGAAVQIRPQAAAAALRAGDKSVNVSLKFRAAKNYPLDVYFLMDLTWSMKDDKETLASLGGDLINALGNLTQNFRVGFGSYVDKPTMPFVDQAHMSNPCSAEHESCGPAYGYRHHSSLNRDTEHFVSGVRDAPVSGNLDNAEGGLDALLQALVCKENVGWARDSRKLVLLASDGILHFAGDGKLGGAIRNNDGECHLDPETGMYTLSTEQDYPTLGQIDNLLLSNKANVIFAVTLDRLDHYMRLSKVLFGSTFVAPLEEDSSNIIQLVRKGYQDIVSSVSFTDNSTSPLYVKYSTSCGGRQRTTESSSCEEVQEGEEYEFTLHLQLDSCPAEPRLWHQKVSVEERGVVNGLELDVELLCGCECESQTNSERCTGHGDYECGVCHCHEGWFGPTCGCTGRNATTLPELDVNCLPAEAALQGIDVCWGRGDCVCGQCECHGESHGTYCECDDSKCDRWGATGERCGGAGRGRCVCGRCECEPGWEGPSCACPSNKNLCVAPGDTKPCSGQGECVCGECVCATADDQARYSGRFCEKCQTCKGLCELYRSCVLCKGFNHECPKGGEDLCHTNSSDAYLDIVTQLHVLEDSDEELCIFTDPQDSCQFKFSYRLAKDRKVKLRVLQSKTCLPPVNTAAIAGGIIALVVMVGILLLLLWRCAVAAKDRIEYQRFMEAQTKAIFEAGENPLYKPAVTYYTVPQGFTGPVEPPSPAPTTPGAASSPL